MFGPIGGAEFLLILVVALLLFGPRRLPQLGRSLGKAIGEFRGAARELKTTIEHEVGANELREVGRDVQSAGDDLRDAVTGRVAHDGESRDDRSS